MSDVPDVGEAVTKKIGPLPGWAWVAIIAGGAWGYTLWKRHSAGTSSASPASLSSTAASPSFPVGTGNAGGGIGFGGATNTVATAPVGNPAVTTNAQWASNVTDQMVANGSNASSVSNALTTYVSGGTLSADQQSIVNQAVTHYGAPPEGVLPVKTDTSVPLAKRYVKYVHHAGDDTVYGITPEGQEIGVTYSEYLALGKPGFEQAPAHDIGNRNANSAHIYVAKDGDTLTSISQRFYGSPDTGKLHAANPGMAEHVNIGTAVYVP